MQTNEMNMNTLKNIRGFKAVRGESIEETKERFFTYISIKKEVEDDLKIMKELIEEKVLENFIETNERFSEDLEELKEMFENEEIDTEELEKRIEELRELARQEMEDGYYNEELGIKANYKVRKKYEWRNEMNEELMNIGALHLAKKVPSEMAKLVDLSDYEDENLEKYMRIYENTTKNKEEKAAIKEIKEHKLEKKKKELQILELEQLIQKFKIEKEKENMLTSFYEEDKETFMSFMQMNDITEINNNEYIEKRISMGESPEELTDRTIRLTDGMKKYNNEKIMGGIFKYQLFALAYYDYDTGEIILYNYLNDGVYKIGESPVYIMGQECANQEGKLTIDGKFVNEIIDLGSVEKRKTKKLKELFKEYVEEKNGFVIEEEMNITGIQLLSAGNFVSEEIEKMIENGMLEQRDVKENKIFVDGTAYFEIIEIEKDEMRRQVFEAKRNRASENKMERDYRNKQIFEEMDL